MLQAGAAKPAVDGDTRSRNAQRAAGKPAQTADSDAGTGALTHHARRKSLFHYLIRMLLRVHFLMLEYSSGYA